MNVLCQEKNEKRDEKSFVDDEEKEETRDWEGDRENLHISLPLVAVDDSWNGRVIACCPNLFHASLHSQLRSPPLILPRHHDSR